MRTPNGSRNRIFLTLSFFGRPEKHTRGARWRDRVNDAARVRTVFLRGLNPTATRRHGNRRGGIRRRPAGLPRGPRRSSPRRLPARDTQIQPFSETARDPPGGRRARADLFPAALSQHEVCGENHADLLAVPFSAVGADLADLRAGLQREHRRVGRADRADGRGRGDWCVHAPV